MASTVSTGNVWSRSHASACGAISASANSRTTLRNCSCSAVRSKSTVRPYPAVASPRCAPVTGASVLAQLPSTGGCAVVRDGDATIVGVRTRPSCAPRPATHAFAVLREVEARRLLGRRARAYDLGRTIERVQHADRRRPRDPRCRVRAVRRRGSSSGRRRNRRSSATARRRACWRRPRGAAVERAEVPRPRRRAATRPWTSSLDRVAHATRSQRCSNCSKRASATR